MGWENTIRLWQTNESIIADNANFGNIDNVSLTPIDWVLKDPTQLNNVILPNDYGVVSYCNKSTTSQFNSV